MKIKTVQEKEILLDYIENVRNGLYTEKGIGAVLKIIPLPYSQLIKEGIKNIPLENTEKLRKALDEMEIKLKSLREINITLSFKPSEVFLNSMHRWLKETLGEDLLINLIEDKNILGGIIVSHNGYYADLSVKKKIEELSFKNL